jgi:hypothetical protein
MEIGPSPHGQLLPQGAVPGRRRPGLERGPSFRSGLPPGRAAPLARGRVVDKPQQAGAPSRRLQDGRGQVAGEVVAVIPNDMVVSVEPLGSARTGASGPACQPPAWLVITSELESLSSIETFRRRWHRRRRGSRRCSQVRGGWPPARLSDRPALLAEVEQPHSATKLRARNTNGQGVAGPTRAILLLVTKR